MTNQEVWNGQRGISIRELRRGYSCDEGVNDEPGGVNDEPGGAIHVTMREATGWHSVAIGSHQRQSVAISGN